MVLDETLGQLSAGLKARAAEYTARQTAEKYGSFVSQHTALVQSQDKVYREVNEFLAAVVTNGNGKREAFLATLATLPTPVLTDTLTVCLLRTEGADRAQWFPDVLQEIGGMLQKNGRANDAKELYAGIRNNIAKHPNDQLLPENVQNAIIECLAEHVIYAPSSQTWQSAPVAHS